MERLTVAKWCDALTSNAYLNTSDCVQVQCPTPPSYNVAPQTFQPIIRLNRDTGNVSRLILDKCIASARSTTQTMIQRGEIFFQLTARV
jgi:hypothetical protein